MRLASLFVVLCAVATFSEAQTLNDQLSRCRGIGDSTARLACYDALDVRTPPAALAPVAGAPATRAAATPPTAAAPPSDSFGLATAKALDSHQSHIAGRFEGWEPDSLITLASGQVWRVVDGTRAWFPNLVDPKVKISSGRLGSYFLEIEGQNNVVRVRRVK